MFTATFDFNADVDEIYKQELIAKGVYLPYFLDSESLRLMYYKEKGEPDPAAKSQVVAKVMEDLADHVNNNLQAIGKAIHDSTELRVTDLHFKLVKRERSFAVLETQSNIELVYDKS